MSGSDKWMELGDGARPCDALIMGRLGSELALIYHDTLQASLPPALRSIVDRLDAALRHHEDETQERIGGRDR